MNYLTKNILSTFNSQSPIIKNDHLGREVVFTHTSTVGIIKVRFIYKVRNRKTPTSKFKPSTGVLLDIKTNYISEKGIGFNTLRKQFTALESLSPEFQAWQQKTLNRYQFNQNEITLLGINEEKRQANEEQQSREMFLQKLGNLQRKMEENKPKSFFSRLFNF